MLKVDLRGVTDFESFLEATPARARKAMSIAMNDVIGGTGLTRYRLGVTAQVNLSQPYVDERLTFDTRASPDNLVATIIGRQRPTSLARFIVGGAHVGQKGVTVHVNKKGSAPIKSGFVVRLNSGGSITDDNYNLGLAVRLRPGQTQVGTKHTSVDDMVHLSANVVLLYGPSIDQVLNNTVIDSETPEVTSAVAQEFYRQFDRLADA